MSALPTKALLFANGEPPINLPKEISQYRYIACTDGAYHNYLQHSKIVPNFIIGDLDSIKESPIDHSIQIIHTPDQNKNDFEKSLLFLIDKGITEFDIYGATGKASDHFLGNLSVALHYYHQITLTFYDNHCQFFFVKPKTTLIGLKGRTISFIPLSKVKNLTITGCKYPLNNDELELNALISLRNEAISNQVEINFSSGDLVAFISFI